MCLTQHLAVGDRSGSAFAPSRDVVGVHVGKFVDFGFVGVVT